MNTRPADRVFAGIAALAFGVSAAVTVAWCTSMTSMPGMEMPGGWTMSMAWMRMPGQGWAGAAATFLGMWSVMMVAMMLPAITPDLAVGRDAVKIAAGYFFAWTLCGAIVWTGGIASMDVAMRDDAWSRAVPTLAAAAMVSAGLLQFTPWKRRQLECCRPGPHRTSAWRHGWNLGLRCIRCCAPLTVALLILGVMDLAAMTAVTVAIAIERRLANGTRWARLTGGLMILLGLSALVRTLE